MTLRFGERNKQRNADPADRDACQARSVARQLVAAPWKRNRVADLRRFIDRGVYSRYDTPRVVLRLQGYFS